MSMWQFFAAVDGYVEAHSTDKGKMTAAEVDDVWEWLQAKDGA